ncbi:MAG TPA: carboxylate-amine ligase [Gammaproteobacteria bacterium]|nr:carboxylate-amine ligase [Gammaproteobacteria bacterium]
MKEPLFTLGIEEEYLLVDPRTRDLIESAPPSLLDRCAARCNDQQVSPELLRSQIEVGTRICHNLGEARAALTELRRMVIGVAAEHGLGLIAASTHPFARWAKQKYTEKARYAALSQEMQATARRLVICGMHVHVGIDDDELRIDLMNQYSYFLPHLLALSSSSPFWEGQDTGLKSYRLTVFDVIPRTGLPERFDSFADYQRHLRIMVDAGLIPDATMIWWDVRPSARYPTLETRIMDVCTNINDALCLAAIVVCTLRMLWRLRRANQRWRMYSRLLLNENRWRAMRYGTDQGLIDLGKGRIMPFPQLAEELLEIIHEDAEALGCVADIERVRHILAHGTSAHHQLKVLAEAMASGASREEALKSVVDYLITETAADT